MLQRLVATIATKYIGPTSKLWIRATTPKRMSHGTSDSKKNGRNLYSNYFGWWPLHKKSSTIAKWWYLGIIGGISVFVIFGEDEKDQALAEGNQNKQRIVILGSGWGALSMMKSLDTSHYDVTVISPRNYFLFTPLLPSATVGTIDCRSIVEPFKKYKIRTNCKNVKFYEAACTSIDFDSKQVICKDVSAITSSTPEFSVGYDYLVVAVGSVPNTFNTPGVVENCHFLKQIEDALVVRNKIIDVFESANLPGTSEEDKKKLLHFLVVGGGPTGVEFAAELHDLVEEDMHKYYSHLMPYVKISLVQSADHILNTYDASISSYAEAMFAREKINLLMHTRVIEVKPNEVKLLDKQKNVNYILPYGLCVWSTGIAPTPLVQSIIKQIPEQSHSKLLVTDRTLRVKGLDNVFAIGDCGTVEQTRIIDKMTQLFKEADVNNDGFLSCDEFTKLINKIWNQYPQFGEYGKKAKAMFEEADTSKDNVLNLEEFRELLIKVDSKMKELPATAQVAAQQGEYLGRAFNEMVKTGAYYSQPFVYKHLGSLAYLGGNTSVADFSGWTLGGWLTWWLWRGTYWSKQVSVRTKFLLGFDWMKTFIFGRDISRF